MIYTEAEHKDKKYKVSDAIASAKLIMFDRHNVKDLNLGVIQKFKLTTVTPITVVELNQLSDQIISDTKRDNKIKF